MDIAAKWRSLGVARRIKPTKLDNICQKNHADPNGCLTHVLFTWLQQSYDSKRFGQPSWIMLCQAVGKPVGGDNPVLARTIAEKHGLTWL